MPEANPYWERLFANELSSAKPEPAFRLRMQAVRRQGYPFLLLPEDARAAQTSLELYPAQTAKARWARMVLRVMLGTPARGLLEKVLVPVDRSGPLARLLGKLGLGGSGEKLGPFGILAGNPATPGQRFLILVFDERARPVAVVKTGLSARAQELVQAESQLIAAAAAKPGVPRLRETLAGPVFALALDFYAGHSPKAADQGSFPGLLSSWLEPGVSRSAAETTAWQSLEKRAAADELMPLLAQRLKTARFVPALRHGDFAPWNIKISAEGRWTVLDWERGELKGVPAWDWFHYVLQPAILVERRDTAELAVRVHQMLASPEFRVYAHQAGIEGVEQEFLLGYLLYMAEVVRPSEGLPQTRALLAATVDSFKAKER